MSKAKSLKSVKGSGSSFSLLSINGRPTEACPVCFQSGYVIPRSIEITAPLLWNAERLFSKLRTSSKERKYAKCEDSPLKNLDKEIAIVGRWDEAKDLAPRDRNEELILVGLEPFLIRMDKVKDVTKDFRLKDFEEFRFVGMGAFGKVFMANLKGVRDESGQPVEVCVKSVKKPKLDAKLDEQVEDILLEVNLMKSFRHPFVMNVKATFQDVDNLYFVMEPMLGDMLALVQFCYLKRKAYMNNKEIRFYSSQIILGIEYMHGLHIVHRDLKIENIFLTDKGLCKIGDFGLAKCISHELDMDRHCGTTAYMAPEMVDKEGKLSYTAAVDWYALGVILYFMSHHDHPYEYILQDNHRSYSNEAVKQVIEHIQFDEETNDSLVNLIKQLLHKNFVYRLCSETRGARDVKSHPYYKSTDWDNVFYSKVSLDNQKKLRTMYWDARKEQESPRNVAKGEFDLIMTPEMVSESHHPSHKEDIYSGKFKNF